MCSEHFTENQFKCINPRTLLWRGSIPHVNGPKSDVLPESESEMIIHEETVQTDQNVPLSNIGEFFLLLIESQMYRLNITQRN